MTRTLKDIPPSELGGYTYSTVSYLRAHALNKTFGGWKHCAVCTLEENETQLSVCSKCRAEAYCSRAHQKERWKVHKQFCNPWQPRIIREGRVPTVVDLRAWHDHNLHVLQFAFFSAFNLDTKAGQDRTENECVTILLHPKLENDGKGGYLSFGTVEINSFDFVTSTTGCPAKAMRAQVLANKIRNDGPADAWILSIVLLCGGIALHKPIYIQRELFQFIDKDPNWKTEMRRMIQERDHIALIPI
ncbi:hypothetical protein BDY24DRAFT_439161 [Mrakia frigida]|uniref:zinc finger MYND domain-containing protein n=1 Tax=Mrakia frigida TaxID=29902 RepID=UPI003FCBF1EB